MRCGAPLLPAGISGHAADLPGRARVARIAPASTIRIGKPFSLPHVPTGRLDREALAEGTERIMPQIEALLPPEQRRV